MSADVEAGWAYRLLEKFGTRQLLFKHENCVGYNYLKSSSVPQELYTNIITTYEGEKFAAETPAFKREIEELMQEHGISIDIFNTEKAKAEYFRARADTLLDTEGRYLFKYPAPVKPSTPAETTTEPIKQPLEAVPPAPAPQISEPVEPPVPIQMPEPVMASAPAPAPKPVSPKVKAVALNKFMGECELLISNNRENWQSDTAEDVRVIVRIFSSILEEHGVKNSAGIEQSHLASLRQHFNNILANYGRSSRLRAMTTARLREETTKELARAARLKQTPPKVGLSNSTIRRHMANLQHFLDHLRASGYVMQPFSFGGIKPKKTSSSKLRRLTEKPDAERIRPIFHIPFFTGCAGPQPIQMKQAGNKIFHSALFYVPMLLTYLGTRRAEIAGLSVDDVQCIDGIWAIHIRENQFRSIKNEQSERVLPVPTEVLRLGFIDYLNRIKKLGYSELFPELYRAAKSVDPGDRFYKIFMPLLKAEGGFDGELWDRTLHALRHGFTDTLKQKNVQLSIIEDITGHLGGTEGQMRYSNAANLKLMQQALAAYPIITGHLEFKSLNMLPSVEKR